MTAKEAESTVDWTAPLSDDEKARSAKVRKANRESREQREKLTPPCPRDGKPGKYVHTEGTYQLAVDVYRCPDGHEFFWRTDLQQGTLISQGSTSKSAK